MNRFGPLTIKTAAMVIVALVVAGGTVLALLRTNENIRASSAEMSSQFPGTFNVFPGNNSGNALSNGITSYATITMSSSTSWLPATQVLNPGQSSAHGSASQTSASNATSSTSSGGGRSIEFFSNVTMTSKSPSSTLSSISSLAYSVGGYVAYSSMNNNSAYVVIRVPADDYQTALTQVESLGTVVSATSNSNDVTVQYTDLNATLASLTTEEHALLKLLNSSTTVNATLEIESQLEQVDAQINLTESQILETARLVAYSTITVSVSKASPPLQPKPLTMKLTVTPQSGVSPLSVTFNAIVTGGTGSYLVNYNFGDGTSSQGQTLVHQFVGGGTYNVTVTATDTNGTVAMTSALVHVKNPPAQYGQAGYASGLLGIFVGEVEGIVEVAVVAVPILLVAALILVPLRRSRIRKDVAVKQS